jgi:hypothetical protein
MLIRIEVRMTVAFCLPTFRIIKIASKHSAFKQDGPIAAGLVLGLKTQEIGCLVIGD